MRESVLPALLPIHRSVFLATGEALELRQGQIPPNSAQVPTETHRLIYYVTISEYQTGGNKSLRILMYASGITLTFELQIDTENELPGAGNIH